MWNKTIENKICGQCNKELPKTEEYFFKRIISQTLKTGEIKTYYSFKSQCKKCHSSQGDEIRIKKRCKEMNCNISDYTENWKKQYSNTRTLFKEINDAPLKNKTTVHNKIRKGYVYTTYEQYRTDCKKTYSQIRRKYDYGDLDFVPKGTQTGFIHLSDAYVSNTLGFKINEIPKEIIETKRLIIQLRRELKTI